MAEKSFSPIAIAAVAIAAVLLLFVYSGGENLALPLQPKNFSQQPPTLDEGSGFLPGQQPANGQGNGIGNGAGGAGGGSSSANGNEIPTDDELGNGIGQQDGDDGSGTGDNQPPGSTPDDTTPGGDDSQSGQEFEFPAGASFPSDFLGEWEIYVLGGNGTARHILITFYTNGEFSLNKGIVDEEDVSEQAPTTETGFDMGGENWENIDVPDYWWAMDFSGGTGTLFIYYDYTLTESYNATVSTDSLSLNSVQFGRVES